MNLGVSQATVSDWMNGKYQPDNNHIQKLAEELSIEKEEMFSENPGVLVTGSRHSTIITNYGTININYASPNEKPSIEEKDDSS